MKSGGQSWFGSDMLITATLLLVHHMSLHEGKSTGVVAGPGVGMLVVSASSVVGSSVVRLITSVLCRLLISSSQAKG